MFEKLFGFFAGLFQASVDLSVRLVSTTWGLIALVVFFFVAIFKVMNWFLGLISYGLLYGAYLIDGMNNPGFITNESWAMDFLVVSNTFFPVSEVFGCIIVVSGVSVFVSIYGFIKSWLPGVSG